MQLESIIYNLPAHVYWKNKNGVYLGCNDMQAKSLGLSSHENIIGKTDYDFCSKEEAEIIRANDTRVMTSGSTNLVEEKIIAADGLAVTYLSQKVPFYDVNSNIMGILGISIDISDIKRKEEEYLTEKDNLQLTFNSVLSNLPEHVYWLDKNNVFIGCNKKQAETFGLDSPSQIIGKTVYDFERKEDADFIVKINNEIMGSGKSVSIEEPFVTSQGERKVFLSKKQPLIDKHKNIIGILGISFDITAEKETEQLRLDKKALEEREAVTQLISASMAHELRTPLSAIEMGMEGIGTVLPNLLESYQMAKEAGLKVPIITSMHYRVLSRVIENSRMEARSALSVIDMLLVNTSTSQIDVEKFKNYSMLHCMDNTLARYPFHEDEKDKIHWKKSDFLFLGDEILMTHVIFNLLKNALYYLNAAGKGDIHIWCDHNEKFNILHIKDTSQGIDPEILPHIFDRFYSRTRHGTGVGLAFCKLVMQSFGGDITCESIKGEYSDFIMRFPILQTS